MAKTIPAPTKQTDELMNVRDTARTLSVSENTVRNLEQRGRIKAVRLPGSGFRRFRREDVERMRAEMWSQFAPETTTDELHRPEPKRRERRQLTSEDYG